MQAAETMKLTGDLLVQKVYLDGRVETVVDEKNVITLVAKQLILSMLYLSSPVPDPINTLKVGIGGVYDLVNGLNPLPITQSLTSLFTPLTPTLEGVIPTSYTVNSAVPSVTFIADLGTGAGNGQLINEAGLFTTSGLMFNIKTFPSIPKTTEFAIHFEWTIKIA